MNNKKAGRFLVILFYLIANVSAVAAGRLITCVEQRNQMFVCLPDAIEQVKNQPSGKHIRIVGYSQDTPGEGKRIAIKFKQQLINGLKEQGIQVDESLFRAVEGGVTGKTMVEVYAD